mgnify:CR=1 FL=1
MYVSVTAKMRRGVRAGALRVVVLVPGLVRVVVLMLSYIIIIILLE